MNHINNRVSTFMNPLRRLVINIRGIIPISLLLLMTACDSPMTKPNILFIAVDDLRTELGIYGHPLAQSPNMDRLASEGTVVRNHYVQVPTCGPSRHSLLTGMRPISKKHLSNDVTQRILSDLPEKDKPETFVHHLRRNGYHTVGIGKISHSADGLLYGYNDQPSEKRELPHSWDELIFNSGKWKTGWNSFFGYADGSNRQGKKKQVKPYESGSVEDEGYVDGLTSNLAVNKLKELKERQEPFFMGVGFFKPHLPFNAPKKYWDLYDSNDIPLSPAPFIPENVHKKSLHHSGEFNQYALTDERPGLSNPISDRYAQKLGHAYLASVSYIDAQIGKILDELKSLSLDENTIVIIWGDHGWHLGDQLVWGKHTLFESSLKSALIIKNPNINNMPSDITSIIETVDIYPTILELCQIESPYPMDGESFADQLLVTGIEKNDVAYSYFNHGISLRTDRYRLTKYYRKESPTIELYDYVTDPHETKNVATDHPDIIKTLMPLLEKGNNGFYKQ